MIGSEPYRPWWRQPFQLVLVGFLAVGGFFLVGVRYDLDSLPGRGWGAVGIQGLAPQFFKVFAIGYVSGDGHLAARLQASYDLLITQRLILQPQIELDQVFVRADGLVVYFAVVPAAFALGHPADHTGREMHRNAPDGRYLHHLMVAVFDSATGVRITNADVTAVVQSAPKPSEDGRVKLESMAVGGLRPMAGWHCCLRAIAIASRSKWFAPALRRCVPTSYISICNPNKTTDWLPALS